MVPHNSRNADTRLKDSSMPSRASDSFGSLVFAGDVMLKRLPPEVFMNLQRRS